MTRSFSLIAALALIALLAVAGCGSSDNGSSDSGELVAVVTTSSVPKLGKIVVDSRGLTLYDFRLDKGGKSACYGTCAQNWPPLITEGKPEAGKGAMASKLGTTERKDGTTQVTYDGRPLYYFIEDKKPGQTTGNHVLDSGAEWYALQPNGEEVDH